MKEIAVIFKYLKCFYFLNTSKDKGLRRELFLVTVCIYTLRMSVAYAFDSSNTLIFIHSNNV